MIVNKQVWKSALHRLFEKAAAYSRLTTRRFPRTTYKVYANIHRQTWNMPLHGRVNTCQRSLNRFFFDILVSTLTKQRRHNKLFSVHTNTQLLNYVNILKRVKEFQNSQQITISSYKVAENHKMFTLARNHWTKKLSLHFPKKRLQWHLLNTLP